MSKVSFVGDEAREVSILPSGILRLVGPDQSFTVPDEFDESYACQPHFFEVEGYPWPPEADTGLPESPPGRPDGPGKPPEASDLPAPPVESTEGK
jgi:hypothetical protein